MNCAELEDCVLDFVEGALDHARQRDVHQHIERCHACQLKVRQTRSLVGDLDLARSVDNRQKRPEAVLSDTPQDSFRGIREIDDFEIIREIGRGGMGIVFEARQRSLNRKVALKLLASGVIQSQKFIQRFQREARAAAKLHHTNIVQVYDQGQQGSCFYYAMALIDGVPLSDKLKIAEPDQRQPRDYRQLARMFAALADALHYAHARDVIHRDIKPHNILWGSDDRLYIADFGLARLLDEPGMTQTAELIGSPAYLAPEQISGDRQRCDHRVDVYGLGVALYETLSGRRPFDGHSYEQVISQVINDQALTLRQHDPNIPCDLDTICQRAMEKSPKDRFASAADMATDLQRFADNYPIRSRPVGLLGRAVRWTKRHPAKATAIAAVLGLGVIVPLLWHYSTAFANERTDAALAVLVQDYRSGDQAQAMLGWTRWLSTQHDTLAIVDALAVIRSNPDESIAILRSFLKDNPDHRDARYLLAWSHRRLMFSRDYHEWTEVLDHVSRADATNAPISALGHFFKGQALSGIDTRQAEQAFEHAIGMQLNFTQAMLHQARAANQLMYVLRDISYYQKAKARLEFICAAQPHKAYPRYLLAITHLLAAEIYAAQHSPDISRLRYAEALETARAAQTVEPYSARGYAVEATYHESVGDLSSAIAAFEHIDRLPPSSVSESDLRESTFYRMRLYFWTGRYASALEMCKRSFPESDAMNANELFYRVLINAYDNNTQAVRSLLDQYGPAHLDAESALLVYAAHILAGSRSATDLLSGDISYDRPGAPGWNSAWAQQMVAFCQGTLPWSEVVSNAKALAGQREEHLHLLMGSAYFYKAIVALSAGHKQQAIDDLTRAYTQFDNENYTFRAKFILNKITESNGWSALKEVGPF